MAGSRVILWIRPVRMKPLAGLLIQLVVPGEDARQVSVTIFAPQGRRIRTLFEGRKQPGKHTIEWDGLTDGGEPAASGVHICGARIGEYATSRKLMLLR